MVENNPRTAKHWEAFHSIAPLKTNRFDDHANDDARLLLHDKIGIAIIIHSSWKREGLVAGFLFAFDTLEEVPIRKYESVSIFPRIKQNFKETGNK